MSIAPGLLSHLLLFRGIGWVLALLAREFQEANVILPKDFVKVVLELRDSLGGEAELALLLLPARVTVARLWLGSWQTYLNDGFSWPSTGYVRVAEQSGGASRGRQRDSEHTHTYSFGSGIDWRCTWGGTPDPVVAVQIFLIDQGVGFS